MLKNFILIVSLFASTSLIAMEDETVSKSAKAAPTLKDLDTLLQDIQTSGQRTRSDTIDDLSSTDLINEPGLIDDLTTALKVSPLPSPKGPRKKDEGGGSWQSQKTSPLLTRKPVTIGKKSPRTSTDQTSPQTQKKKETPPPSPKSPRVDLTSSAPAATSPAKSWTTVTTPSKPSTPTLGTNRKLSRTSQVGQNTSSPALLSDSSANVPPLLNLPKGETRTENTTKESPQISPKSKQLPTPPSSPNAKRSSTANSLTESSLSLEWNRSQSPRQKGKADKQEDE